MQIGNTCLLMVYKCKIQIRVHYLKYKSKPKMTDNQLTGHQTPNLEPLVIKQYQY
jgi:hypothetical protein